MATKHVTELLSMLGAGTAGVSTASSDGARVKRWTENILYLVRGIFLKKREDAYANWLRPDTSEPPGLVSYSAEGVADPGGHHSFAAGEGLVGKAWSRGKAAGHSPGRPHEWWVARKGCENNAFICAPAGPFEGTGGVLGVGSDKGFEVTDEDVAIVQMFALLLGLVAHLLPIPAGRPGNAAKKAARSASSRGRPGG